MFCAKRNLRIFQAKGQNFDEKNLTSTVRKKNRHNMDTVWTQTQKRVSAKTLKPLL